MGRRGDHPAGRARQDRTSPAPLRAVMVCQSPIRAHPPSRKPGQQGRQGRVEYRGAKAVQKAGGGSHLRTGGHPLRAQRPTASRHRSHHIGCPGAMNQHHRDAGRRIVVSDPIQSRKRVERKRDLHRSIRPEPPPGSPHGRTDGAHPAHRPGKELRPHLVSELQSILKAGRGHQHHGAERPLQQCVCRHRGAPSDVVGPFGQIHKVRSVTQDLADLPPPPCIHGHHIGEGAPLIHPGVAHGSAPASGVVRGRTSQTLPPTHCLPCQSKSPPAHRRPASRWSRAPPPQRRCRGRRKHRWSPRLPSRYPR